MSAENVRIVEEFQAALPSDDIVGSVNDPVRTAEVSAELERLAGPDFEVAMVGPNYAPGGLTGVGPDGFHGLWLEWTTPFESFRIEVEQMIDAGDQVVTLVRQVGRTKTGGVEIEARAGSIWTVRDGRVVRIELHLDPDEAMRRAGLDSQSSQE